MKDIAKTEKRYEIIVDLNPTDDSIEGCFMFCFSHNRYVLRWTKFLFLTVQMVMVVSLYAQMSFLDNRTIKIGVDLNKGGVITFLADSNNLENVVNTHDMGRMIQQSYYSGPSPYGSPHPAYPKWNWNPVAAGDVYGHTSQVVSHSNDGKMLYVKNIPMQWALCGVPAECTFEQWIELDGNVAKVRCRLINARTDSTQQYPASDQELPAVYTQGRLYRLFSYTGSEPFTSGPLVQIKNSGPPWKYFNATENWSALVQDNDWGLGVFSPGVQFTVGGFHEAPGGNPTGYVSPLHKEIIDYNITYVYEYHLILGYLNDIRQYVYRHQPPNMPNYRFEEDRQHFTYENAIDSGWPVRGRLRIYLNQADPFLLAPVGLWKAADVPLLCIRAAYHTENTEAKIYWKNFGDTNFIETKSVPFGVVSDGQYHNYIVNLAMSPNYTGVVTQIRFDPVETISMCDYVDIEAITCKFDSLNIHSCTNFTDFLFLLNDPWLRIN